MTPTTYDTEHKMLTLEYKAKTTYTTLSIRFKIHMKIHSKFDLIDNVVYVVFGLYSRNTAIYYKKKKGYNISPSLSSVKKYFQNRKHINEFFAHAKSGQTLKKKTLEKLRCVNLRKKEEEML
jgi:hypothetical protein